MPDQDAATWAVLRDPFLSGDADTMLGVLVVDRWRPTDEMYPTPNKIPFEKLKPFLLLPYEDEDVTQIVKSVKNTALKASLGSFLLVDLSDGSNQTTKIKSKVVTTHRLKEYREAFKTLMNDQNYGEKIKEGLRDQNTKELFMIVGIKTAKDAEFDKSLERTQNTVWMGSVPASAAASAATGVPVGAKNDPRVQGSSNQVQEAVASGTAKGERAFAFQYCNIRMKQSRRSWTLDLHESTEFGGLHKFKPKEYAFGSDDSESEDVCYSSVEGDVVEEISVSSPVSGLDMCG